MQVAAYLNFNGDCEAAFKLYEQCLGGVPGPIFRYGGSPLAETVSPEWADKVMHASISIGGQMLMGADVTPDQYEAPKGITLSLHTKVAAEAERVFLELATDGHVVSPLEKTFWAERFGMVVDRFGIPWMINCESSEAPPPQVIS
jgi:PhnB protein